MIRSGQCFLPLLEAALGGEIDPLSVCIARLVPDPVAIFAFAGWDGESVEAMLWSAPGGLSRDLLRACGEYVFGELKCARVSLRVDADNHQMLRLAPRLGFVHEGTMRRAHAGRDVLIFGMLHEECRWI